MEAPCSTLRLFTAAAPDGNSQSVAEGVVHIFALGRRAVFDLILPGDHRLDGLGCQPASRIVIQMEIDRFHMRVFLQKAGKGHRQLALRNLFLRLVHPGQGQLRFICR